MNILINSYCNLNCPYCFANTTMEDKGAQNMSIENFKIAIDWCKKLNQHQMRLIGGEPTLCPNFGAFLDMTVKDPWFDTILIFSNLTFEKEIAQKIAEIDRIVPVHMLPNINEFHLLLPKYKKNILYNISYLSQNLVSFGEIGINIYRPDMDLSQWEQIMRDFPRIRTVRYSIAIPTKQTLNDPSFDYYNYYHQFQPLLLQLNDIAVRYNAALLCDCNNLPLCCFDDWAVKEFIKGSAFDLFACMIDDGYLHRDKGIFHCGYPVIDLRPDLTLAGCFGLDPKQRVEIVDFASVEELMDWIYRDGDRSDYIARKECLTCSRYLRTGKSCGCRSCHMIKKEDIINDKVDSTR